MIEVYLIYNPYTHSRKLTINGEEIRGDELNNFCGEDDSELSTWCKDFYEKIQRRVNDDFTVKFTGIDRDYEFLETALNSFKDKANVCINLNFYKRCIVEDKIQELKNIFEKMQNYSPYEALRSKDIKNIFESTINSECEMAVVATMSSGKSTLINAMLGREILPARNEATTANIAKIHDLKTATCFTADSYDKDNNLLEHVDNLTAEKMEQLNDIEISKASTIEIYGNIEGIKSQDINLVLTDTPGPNNSKTDEHKEHTYRLLKSPYKPMILYILNATQLETNDDNILLSDVAEKMNSGDRQSRDRFIFILNKADQLNEQKGETIEKNIQTVKNYLARHDIINPRVFPCSALHAKLIRQFNNKDPKLTSKEDMERRMQLMMLDMNEALVPNMSSYAPFLSDSTKTLMDKKIKEAKDNNDKDALLLCYSGVPAVELAISEYLTKYALPAKISEGISSFKYLIDGLNIEANEIKSLEGNKARVLELQDSIANAKQEINKGEKAKGLIDKIDSYSCTSDLDSAYNDSKNNFLKSMHQLIGRYSTSGLSSSTAACYVREIKEGCSQLQSKFRVELESIVTTAVYRQITTYSQEFIKYIKELGGNFNIGLNSKAILGELPQIRYGDIKYKTHSKQVISGYHEERNPYYVKIWDGFLNIFRTVKKAKTIQVPEYKTVTHTTANINSFINTLYSSIEDSLEDYKDMVYSSANKLQNTLKSEYKKLVEHIDELINKKLAEQQEYLNDQSLLEAKIKENNERLEWLENINNELQNFLDLGE